TRLLEEWLKLWADYNRVSEPLRVELRPVTAALELLELRLLNAAHEKAANVVFSDIQDRHGHKILLIRDQNTFEPSLRHKRLMTLVHLFLVHRYRTGSVTYVTPSEDNQYQTQKMKVHGIFSKVDTEVGEIIVATVNTRRIAELLSPDRAALKHLISKR